MIVLSALSRSCRFGAIVCAMPEVIWVSYAPEASLWGRERPSLVHGFNLLFQSLELRLTHAGGPFDHGPLHFLS